MPSNGAAYSSCDQRRVGNSGLDRVCVWRLKVRIVFWKTEGLRRKPHRLADGRVTSAVTRQEPSTSHCNLNGLTAYSSVVQAFMRLEDFLRRP